MHRREVRYIYLSTSAEVWSSFIYRLEMKTTVSELQLQFCAPKWAICINVTNLYLMNKLVMFTFTMFGDLPKTIIWYTHTDKKHTFIICSIAMAIYGQGCHPILMNNNTENVHDNYARCDSPVCICAPHSSLFVSVSLFGGVNFAASFIVVSSSFLSFSPFHSVRCVWSARLLAWVDVSRRTDTGLHFTPIRISIRFDMSFFVSLSLSLNFFVGAQANGACKKQRKRKKERKMGTNVNVSTSHTWIQKKKNTLTYSYEYYYSIISVYWNQTRLITTAQSCRSKKSSQIAFVGADSLIGSLNLFRRRFFLLVCFVFVPSVFWFNIKPVIYSNNSDLLVRRSSQVESAHSIFGFFVIFWIKRNNDYRLWLIYFRI